MAPLYIKKTLMRAVIETTYGTFQEPAASDVQWVENLKIEPLMTDVIKDGVICGKTGADPVIHVNEHVTVEFDFAFRGAGTAGDIPAYDVLLRSAAHAVTQNADNVTYTLVDDVYESASAVIHYDGNRHPISGLRGTVSFSGSSGNKMYFKFKGIGLYIDPTAAAFVAPDCSAIHTVKPLVLNSKSSFTFRGLSPVLYSISDEYGASVRLENNINQKEVEYGERDMSLSLEIRASSVTDQNFYTQTLDGSTGVANLVVGDTAGHIVEIDMPKTQFLAGPTYGEHENVRTYNLNSSLLPINGNDEQVIIVR